MTSDTLTYTEYGAVLWCENSSGSLSFRAQGPCAISVDGIVRFSQLSSQTWNRKAGPASIEPCGTLKYSSIDGRLHRTDGPAIILPDGSKSYWVDSASLTPEEFFLKYGVL